MLKMESSFFNTSISTSLLLPLDIFTKVRLGGKCSIVTIPGLEVTNIPLTVSQSPLRKDKTWQAYHYFHSTFLYALHSLVVPIRTFTANIHRVTLTGSNPILDILFDL